jgi:hypothetical protein
LAGLFGKAMGGLLFYFNSRLEEEIGKKTKNASGEKQQNDDYRNVKPEHGKILLSRRSLFPRPCSSLSGKNYGDLGPLLCQRLLRLSLI